MGRKELKKQYRDDWTPDKPTAGYCYVVAEVVYHCLAPTGSKVYCMNISDNETHWFIVGPEGEVLDFTANQFDSPIDYSKGKPRNFMTKHISRRGKILANLLGLEISFE